MCVPLRAAPELPLLVQGDQHLASLADLEPELGVGAVAGAVPAAPRREPLGPPAQ